MDELFEYGKYNFKLRTTVYDRLVAATLPEAVALIMRDLSDEEVLFTVSLSPNLNSKKDASSTTE